MEQSNSTAGERASCPGSNVRAAASALAALQALDKACSKSRHPAAG